ncbi:hypothetical protein TRFO_37077 [Tritrichomonas foetus]|uniref:Uncharacterized protein n=1 Tax=Tritrichomonas foetus TaxID=1144522 RepID=A0A1J4JC62_9EUKA|nr:hypothetical protein TRFO_37077 [Tritrichomonas foetus]|eukprot:OHS96728.1 hypothetical protein TRFO_37077 [Tritrichomonas foetus]
MKAKKKDYFINQPISNQVSFVVNTVKGDHLGKQSLIVSVNGHLFILHPRTIQKRFRFYDSGFTSFIEPSPSIQISIGIFTPSKEKGYLHSFISYSMKSPLDTISQVLDLHSYGNSYIVSLSLFISPCYIYQPAAFPRPDKRKKEKPASDGKSSVRQKKLDSDSFSERYSLSYTMSESDYSSSYNDQEYDDKPSFPNLLSSFETDETTTMSVTSNSDI